MIHKNHLIILIILISSTILSQNKWERLENLTGGDVRTIYKTSSNLLFIGCYYGGMYKLDQENYFWNHLENNSNDFIICYGSNFKNELFAANYNSEILKSTDNGDTWVKTSLNKQVFCFKKDIINGLFWAGSYGIILKSLDDGNSWSIDTLSLGDQVRSIEINDFGTIFASTWGGGLFTSSDGGNNWSKVNANFPSDNISTLKIWENNIYVGVGYNFYKSSDEGKSWVNLFNVSDYFISMDMDIYGNIFLATTQLGLFKSTDGGNLFGKITSLPVSELNQVFYDNVLNRVYICSQSGIYYSEDDGELWSEMNFGLHNLRVNSLAIGKYDEIFVGTRYNSWAVYKSLDYGRDWVRTNLDYKIYELEDLTPDIYGNIYALKNEFYKYDFNNNSFNNFLNTSYGTAIYNDNFGNVYFITDDDIYRTTKDNIIEIIAPTSGLNVRGVTSDSEGNLFAINTEYHFSDPTAYFKSYNFNSKTWTTLLTLEHTVTNGLVIDALDNIYFACSNYNGLLKSSDRGKDWIEIYPFSVYDILIDSLNNIYITTGYNILKSTNGGINWAFLNDFAVNSFYTTIALTKRGNLIASADFDGLYRYLDLSYPVIIYDFLIDLKDSIAIISWQTEDDCKNLGFELERSNDSINWEMRGFVPGNQADLCINSIYSFTDTLITEGTYFFRLKQIATDSLISYSKPIETEYLFSVFSFYLFQNYPNPFNPKTTIEYEVPEKSNVTIKIYDILGREVKTLVNNEEKIRWKYKVEFDATNLASGVYFYRMQAGSFTETKKMVVLK